MRVHGVRHLPVIQGDLICGILSRHDLYRTEVKKTSVSADAAIRAAVRGLPPDTRLSPCTLLPLGLRLALNGVPHPSKSATGGEDAAFAWIPQSATYAAFAIADGVGSWSFEKGIDPSKFSRAMVTAALNAVMTDAAFHAPASAASICGPPLRGPLLPDPQRALQFAWDDVLRQPEALGSSTMCVAVLNLATRELVAANLGDSGFLIIRRHLPTAPFQPLNYGGYTVAYISPPQQVSFNLSYQLGHAPPSMPAKFQTPADAEMLRVPIHEGDVIIMARLPSYFFFLLLPCPAPHQHTLTHTDIIPLNPQPPSFKRLVHIEAPEILVA